MPLRQINYCEIIIGVSGSADSNFTIIIDVDDEFNVDPDIILATACTASASAVAVTIGTNHVASYHVAIHDAVSHHVFDWKVVSSDWNVVSSDCWHVGAHVWHESLVAFTNNGAVISYTRASFFINNTITINVGVFAVHVAILEHLVDEGGRYIFEHAFRADVAPTLDAGSLVIIFASECRDHAVMGSATTETVVCWHLFHFVDKHEAICWKTFARKSWEEICWVKSCTCIWNGICTIGIDWNDIRGTIVIGRNNSHVIDWSNIVAHVVNWGRNRAGNNAAVNAVVGGAVVSVGVGESAVGVGVVSSWNNGRCSDIVSTYASFWNVAPGQHAVIALVHVAVGCFKSIVMHSASTKSVVNWKLHHILNVGEAVVCEAFTVLSWNFRGCVNSVSWHNDWGRAINNSVVSSNIVSSNIVSSNIVSSNVVSSNIVSNNVASSRGRDRAGNNATVSRSVVNWDNWLVNNGIRDNNFVSAVEVGVEVSWDNCRCSDIGSSAAFFNVAPDAADTLGGSVAIENAHFVNSASTASVVNWKLLHVVDVAESVKREAFAELSFDEAVNNIVLNNIVVNDWLFNVVNNWLFNVVNDWLFNVINDWLVNVINDWLVNIVISSTNGNGVLKDVWDTVFVAVDSKKPFWKYCKDIVFVEWLNNIVLGIIIVFVEWIFNIVVCIDFFVLAVWIVVSYIFVLAR